MEYDTAPTVESLLDDLFELLKDPDHWTQHCLARKEDDVRIFPSHPDAVKWCLVGGIDKVTPLEFRTLQYELKRLIYQELKKKLGLPYFEDSLSSFNDRFTHFEVLDLIDSTRKSLRSAGHYDLP
jgi:hypothetical protein